MKKSLILLVVLAALVGVAVVTKKQKEDRLSEIARRGVKTRELLLPGLDVNAIKAIQVKSKDQETNLKLGDNGWTVGERDGYGVDFDKLSRALMELRETKIARKQLIGRGAWADAEVLEPAEGVSEGAGTLVKLSDDKGGEVATLILGGDVEVSGGNSPQFGQASQRLVRIPADEDSLWMVGTNLGSFQPKPEEWLDKSFISVQDMKTLAVTPPKKEDAWKVSRPTKDIPDYTLEGAKEGDELDSSKLTLASLLASATFNDVKPKAQAGDLFKEATKVQITTFDGFTYDIQLAKQSQDGASKYFMTVAVKADLPKERKAGKDEKEEDKKLLDEEFKAEQGQLKEKLEKEQKLADWIYEVAEYSVNSLLVTRGEIMKAPESEPESETPPPAASALPSIPSFSTPMPAPAPAPAETPAPATEPEAKPEPAKPDAKPKADAGAAQAKKDAAAKPKPADDPLKPAPSVTTPPVAVPPAPKPAEIKPAPKPDDNPAVPKE